MSEMKLRCDENTRGMTNDGYAYISLSESISDNTQLNQTHWLEAVIDMYEQCEDGSNTVGK